MEEWSFEVGWSQILCSLVGFTKTNVATYYKTYFHSSADYLFFKDISCLFILFLAV